MDNKEFNYFISLLKEVSEKYRISESDSREIIEYVYKHIKIEDR